MPTLSIFFGIIVRMYRELGGQDIAPHELYELSNPV